MRYPRYATKEQFYTTAHLAYARGASGIYAFNFVYYRNIGQEPPFEIFTRLRDPHWLAQQSQHYVYTDGWQPGAQILLPKTMKPDSPVQVKLDMAPPKGGWKNKGRLRIQCDTDFNNAILQVKFNNLPLVKINTISEPYPQPYPLTEQVAHTHRNTRTWEVPATLLRDGVNTIDIVMTRGIPTRLVYIDLAIP
jgi:hypothetical protein